MNLRLSTRLVRGFGSPILKNGTLIAPIRQFSVTKENKAKNRVYASIRREDDFSSLLLISTSTRTPLLTLWTASYSNASETISPLLQELINSGVGEEEGGVNFAEVEYDAPDIDDSGIAMDYMITSMPTLLSFDRGEAQTGTKVTDSTLMMDREYIKEWIRTEAKRKGDGGAGANAGGGLFGGLFGLFRKS